MPDPCALGTAFLSLWIAIYVEMMKYLEWNDYENRTYINVWGYMAVGCSMGWAPLPMASHGGTPIGPGQFFKMSMHIWSGCILGLATVHWPNEGVQEGHHHCLLLHHFRCYLILCGRPVQSEKRYWRYRTLTRKYSIWLDYIFVKSKRIHSLSTTENNIIMC